MDEKRAILVSKEHDEEFLSLAESLNLNILETVYFKENTARYFISFGKLEYIKKIKNLYNAEIVIINGDLKSTQWYNLEKELDIEVEDRIRLIIEIFRDRAQSTEARLETELAKLKYEVPLLKEWVHKSKKGEHPGFMAAGEYDASQYLDHIRKKMKKINDTLEKIKKQRDIQRKNRNEKGYFLVSLAGYTNSGKSTLMKALSGEDVLIEGRMFSTLVPKIAKVKLKQKVLITDTVGFIKNTPPWLIESFSATLEEIYRSDLVLLIIDGTDPLDVFNKKFDLSYQILKEHSKSKIITIINKIDLKPAEIERKVEYAQSFGTEVILISAKQNEHIEEVLEAIEQSIEFDKEYDFAIRDNVDYGPLLSFIYEYGKLIEIEKKDKYYIKFKMNSKYNKKLQDLNYIFDLD
ncbi:MAG: GTPase HflX [Thermoplasmata archaeon]